jgi:signal transduction histidine kinase
MPGAVAPVGASAKAIVSAMKRLHAAKALRFITAIPDELVVQCDPMDLSEMLANLIDNACKWGREEVRISAAEESRAGPIAIIVEDDGPGLPPEAMEVVFRIGERLDEQVPGSGLGLPIVRDLAQLYGGAIRLERAASGGLRAILTLPKAR